MHDEDIALGCDPIYRSNTNVHSCCLLPRWSADLVSSVVLIEIIVACAFADRKHVVFGQVTRGYSVVKAIEAVGSSSGAVAHEVLVADCGVCNADGAAINNP